MVVKAMKGVVQKDGRVGRSRRSGGNEEASTVSVEWE